ncbi:MAG: acyltransferase [Verrucomicrobiota bacterium]
MVEKSKKLLEFEGLRGIAAMMVVFAHIMLTFFVDMDLHLIEWFKSLPWPLNKIARVCVHTFFDGSFAVFVFWTMSGFVLSLRFFSYARDGIDDKARHYVAMAAFRRYPRLFIPVFVSVLFGWVLLEAGLIKNRELAAVLGPDYQKWLGSAMPFEPSILHALGSAIWESFFNFEAATSYNAVLWTIELEFFGSFFIFAFLALIGGLRVRYLAYPLLFAIIWALQLHWLNAFLGGLILSDWYVNREDFMSRVPAGLLKVYDRLRNSPIVFLMVAGVLWIFIGMINYWNVLHLLLSIATLFVLMEMPLAARVFSSRIPVFLGKISFGLYLAHLPIVYSLSCGLYLGLYKQLGHIPTVFVCALVTIVASVLGGYLMYRFADRPSIGISKRLAAAAFGFADRGRGS